MYAARGNCRECVEVLLKHKADVNLADPSFVVPLFIAMINGNWDIAKRLIEAGADVNQWDMNGSAPLLVAIENLSNAGQPQSARSGQAQQGLRPRRDQDAAGSRREPEPAALLGRELRRLGRSRHYAVPRSLQYRRHPAGEAAAGTRCESQARHVGRARPHHHGAGSGRPWQDILAAPPGVRERCAAAAAEGASDDGDEGAPAARGRRRQADGQAAGESAAGAAHQGCSPMRART